MIARLWYAVRKTGWFWCVVGEWSWPQTHYRKAAMLDRWLQEQDDDAD